MKPYLALPLLLALAGCKPLAPPVAPQSTFKGKLHLYYAADCHVVSVDPPETVCNPVPDGQLDQVGPVTGGEGSINVGVNYGTLHNSQQEGK